MLQYSARALPAIIRLFRRFNDINIFVEDETYTNMYRIYVQRMLGTHAKVKKIFPLGGKTNVIRKSQDLAFVESHKPCLFIIDGDLDLSCGNPIPKGNNLHRLSVYCAENLLICKQAAIEICFESSADESKEAIEKKIQFENWSKTAIDTLGPLFVEYAIAYHCNIQGITTARYGISQLLRGEELGSPQVNQRISDRINFVRSEIINQVGTKKYREALRHIKSVVAKSKTPLHLISAKTYLLPALHRHLRKHTDFRDAESALRTRMAKHANLSNDQRLCSKLLKACAE